MNERGFIDLDEKDQVVYITLNRGETNLIDIPMMAEINTVLHSVTERRDAKALVIRSVGPIFSGGLDYTLVEPDAMEKLIHPYHKMFRMLDRIECPTIALVRGAALGAGCELACFCDMVLSAEGARFGLPDIKLGLFAPVATADFPRYGHLKQIYELLLVGDTILADEARRMGLVNHVFPAAEFENRCDEFIYRLAANPYVVLRLAKRAMRFGLGRSFPDALIESESIFLRDTMATLEARDGLAALRKRQDDGGTPL